MKLWPVVTRRRYRVNPGGLQIAHAAEGRSAD